MKIFGKLFYGLKKLKEMASITYVHRRQMQGSLLSAKDRASQQEVATSFLTETKGVLSNFMSQKTDAHTPIEL